MAIKWRRIIALMLIAIAGGLSGCTAVEPWERGKLAKKQMAPNAYPLRNKLRTHVQNSREGATGGDVAAAGGGCGCY